MSLSELLDLDHKLWRERIADKQQLLAELQAMNEALLDRLDRHTVQAGDPNYIDSGQMRTYGEDKK